MFTPSSSARAASLLSLVVCLAACTDQVTTPDAGTPPSEVASAARAPVDAAAPVARGIAMALAQPGLRRQLLEDLRDSPFPRHKLHLKSYLHGRQGRAFAVSAAQALRVHPEAFLASLDALPEMELVVYTPRDRARWTGDRDLLVVGTTTPRAEALAGKFMTGYTTEGTASTHHVAAYMSSARIYIIPAETDFGPDPEGRRQAAPGRTGNTISTREDEISIQATCEEEWRRTECPGDGTGPNIESGGIQLASQFTWTNCTNGVPASEDIDADGIRDQCEYELAWQFRPHLYMSPADDTRSRESYWAVAKDPLTGLIRIFYALGYHRDGGENTTGIGSHTGDSEFIVLKIKEANVSSLFPNPARWILESAALSAHFGQPGDGTATYPYGQLAYPSGTPRSRPKIWVAEEKHANWPSGSACGWGVWGFDECSANNLYEDVEVRPTANLGNSSPYGIPTPNHNGVCIGSLQGHPGLECFWASGINFLGWQGGGGGGGAGPYAESLWMYAF
jgi:hypothetical protein